MAAPVVWADVERLLGGEGPFGLDAEWSDDGTIRCWSVAWGPPRPPRHRGPWGALRGAVLLADQLGPARGWLEDPAARKVGSTLQDADLPRFRQAGVELGGIAGCAVTLARLWEPDADEAGLKHQAARFLSYPVDPFGDVTGYIRGTAVEEPQSAKGYRPVESCGAKVRPEGPYSRLQWGVKPRRADVAEVMADPARVERFFAYAVADAVMALDLWWFWRHRLGAWQLAGNRPAVRGVL